MTDTTSLPKTITFLDKVENGVYLIAGGLLGLTAFIILGKTLYNVVTGVYLFSLRDIALHLLDDLLLVLILVELLHTILVSLKTHVIKIVPFLAIGLIASIRRILIITVEASHLSELSATVYQRSMIEIGVLIFSILILVISIFLIRRSSGFVEDA